MNNAIKSLVLFLVSLLLSQGAQCLSGGASLAAATDPFDPHAGEQTRTALKPGSDPGVPTGISAVECRPDPFLPRGKNGVEIVVRGAPGQKGLSLRFYSQAFSLWWKDKEGGYGLPLVETRVPGVYKARWRAVYSGGQYIMPRGRYVVYVYDAAGNQLPVTGELTLQGFESVTVSPDPFVPGGDSRLDIKVRAEHGLKLEARIFQEKKASPIRVLPLHEVKEGAFSCQWDGKDDKGQYPGAGTYEVRIHPAGSKVPYRHPEVSVRVKPCIFSMTLVPEPFVPAGTNRLSIMASGDPMQKGLYLVITHPDKGDTPRIPLVETSEPGTYEARWNGVMDGVIPRKAQCKITVYDAAGRPFPAWYSFLLDSASEITVTPNPYLVSGEKKATVQVSAADGLNLVARIGKAVSLSLRHSGHDTYVASWDGRDASGKRVSYGEYEVTLWNAASELRYDVKATLEVTVDNKPPVLKPIGQQDLSEGQRVILKILASDPDGDTVHYSVEHLPPGAVFDPATGVFNWKPGYDDAGIYTVTFIATDNGIPPLSAFENVTFKVDNVNRPPILQHVGPQVVDEGQPLSVLIVAMDPDGDPLRFHASGLPKGAIFRDYGDGTAVLKWRPGYGEAGRYSVFVTVCEKVATVNCALERIPITVRRVKIRSKVPGDLNHDHRVDKKDYALFFKVMGLCRGDKGFNVNADFDNDGCITFVDYQIWSTYYKGKRKAER